MDNKNIRENIYFIIYLFIFKHLVYLNKFKFFTRSQKKLIKIIQIIIQKSTIQLINSNKKI